MRTILFLCILVSTQLGFSQVDYSDAWQDFFSYNNVKDFVKVGNVVYALTDNAVFTYDETTAEIRKFSSVQGLSGETTSAIHYNATFNRLVIGYENGLIEVIDDNGSITISSDIINFNQSGIKRINDIAEFGNTLYISTPFAIIEYDIENLEFGDTFFIGNASSSVEIHNIIIVNNTIYATTVNGLFSADVTSNLLVDFNNWKQEFSGRNLNNATVFNNQIYLSENTSLFLYNNAQLIQQRNFSENIIDLRSSETNFAVTLQKRALLFDDNFNTVTTVNTTPEFDFSLATVFFENNSFYLATAEFGILKGNITNPDTYQEIHPEGPLSNSVFNIAVLNNHLWVVYGGYDITYTPINTRKGFSHFNGQNWINTPYNPQLPFRDFTYVSIDPNAENRVFISSFGSTNDANSTLTGGLLEVENDEIKTFYNQQNSPLEDILPNNPSVVTIRINGTVFDSESNLWVSNIGGQSELKKLSPSGQWTSYDISAAKTSPSFGLSEVELDRAGNVWMGSRGNGAIAFNERNAIAKSLIATPNLGDLPDANVNTVAIDGSNRVWLGTRSGMVVFRNASSIFTSNVVNATPIVIEENGIGERLLGDQFVNTIEVDGADNKWFGTDSGGVIYTNPSGLRTLANFSKQNSPLPSNKILKIKVDDTNGKVYFATDKGIVAYNSNVSPFGESLGEVYAYPNPALKNHETVTITGRNGTSLPKGINVKIVDVAGNLVYETNVVEGQELQGGKVVWNKKNLAGKRVASGIYIVLLTNDDASETTTTKIAIVN